MNLTIRKETQTDFREVEELTRKAFWNQYVMGCDEHYFLHKIRKSPSFLPELDFVASIGNEIVGHIAYMSSRITDINEAVFETITFGPISVLPELQRRGIGSQLILHSIGRAKELGYKAIVTYGDPEYYKRFGFVVSKGYGIADEQGKFPYSMLVLELECGALGGVSGKFSMRLDYQPSPEEVEEFDKSFPPMEKIETESQKYFADVSTRYL